MKVLYIISDSRSGSTLLQHLLALQDGVVALGEVRRLERLINTGGLCNCGRPIKDCPFWIEVSFQMKTSLNSLRTISNLSWLQRQFKHTICWTGLKLNLETFTRIFLRYERRIATDCIGIYQAVQQITGNQIIVDASKVPLHYLYIYLEARDLIYPIFLVRDGRAVVWSKMQRNGLSATQASKQWLKVSRMMLAIQQVIPYPPIFIHYEELCRNPSAILESILEMMNIPIKLFNLKDLPTEIHGIGGSPHFRFNRQNEIKLDENWRNTMPKKAINDFNKVAGKINQTLGYDINRLI